MMDATLYPRQRQAGKTKWLIDQTDEDVAEGKHVAIVVPTATHFRHADYELPGWVDVFTETSFRQARGYHYDHIYIEDADLFQDEPADLCARFDPRVPVTMTYTPR